MSPRKGQDGRVAAKVDLKTLKPTPEELQEARQLIEANSDPHKKAKACMATFTNWMKSTNVTDPEVLNSKLDKRKEFMLLHMV